MRFFSHLLSPEAEAGADLFLIENSLIEKIGGAGFQLECGATTISLSFATLKIKSARSGAVVSQSGRILHDSQAVRHSPVKRCTVGSNPTRAASFSLGERLTICHRDPHGWVPPS